ncbi:phenoloxidase-activating factor 2-like [Toxorhynchites rutilus septentrionalis]|uniref:phenoloxidase-activating factor 2-like n=1 Tax=Toxorhynchites rutilus septentrionalis TaxID=329112 RepID=UPI00247942FC|nr:phenoloxidase-activating factor 2-like [Toxorhynchites rutilus septentrionalis]
MQLALVAIAIAVAVANAQSIDKIYFPENETSILEFANRASIDEIVTPDPLGPNTPTLSPMTLITAQGGTCTCVPYFMCRPEPEFADQNKFNEIDVNYNPETCQDVLDVCCRPEDSLVVPMNNTPGTVPPGRPRGCGLRNIGGIDFTLTGNFNNEAGFGEFPWTVAILKTADGSSHCGGSLIHPNLVLTGAHCVQGYRRGDLMIRAGEWDTQTTKERLPFQERLVSRINSHPDFNPRSLAFDVAILELESPVALSDHISVACLPPTGYDSRRTSCFASGWGKNQFGKAGRYSVIMKKVPLPLVDSSTCERQLQSTRLTRRFRLHQSFICAGGEQGVDTCEGDGGAPLVCPVGNDGDNRYIQVGTVAWGIGCHERIPGVYASVITFKPWIDNIVRTLGFDTSVYDPNLSQFSGVFK